MDLKSHIDTIADVTKADKISYVGYSQGTLLIASALDGAVQEGNEELAKTISKLDQVLMLTPCPYHITSDKVED